MTVTVPAASAWQQGRPNTQTLPSVAQKVAGSSQFSCAVGLKRKTS
jgi:hypothetical protein